MDNTQFTDHTYPRLCIIQSDQIFGRVRDFDALRQAIDLNPHLCSARLSGDHHAIMVELNQFLPDGMLVSIEDVSKAMALRPVEQPLGIVQATGRATAFGGARIGFID